MWNIDGYPRRFVRVWIIVGLEELRDRKMTQPDEGPNSESCRSVLLRECHSSLRCFPTKRAQCQRRLRQITQTCLSRPFLLSFLPRFILVFAFHRVAVCKDSYLPLVLQHGMRPLFTSSLCCVKKAPQCTLYEVCPVSYLTQNTCRSTIAGKNPQAIFH